MATDAILWRRWRLLGATAVGASLLLLGQMTVASKDGMPQLLFARQWITRLWPSDGRDILHRTSESVMYPGASAAWMFLLARGVGSLFLRSATHNRSIQMSAGHKKRLSTPFLGLIVLFAAAGVAGLA